MYVGYARVSSTDQQLHLQQDALTQAGCGRIFTDTISGAKAERPGLAAAFSYLREGDVLAVWRLDRLGRSLKDLLELVTALEQRGIGLKSLQESMDTTTPGGRLILHVFGALAEFERGIIRERTQAGLTAAGRGGATADGRAS
jgi:DNA invertase Pin-like site-specific DNA recombinase